MKKYNKIISDVIVAFAIIIFCIFIWDILSDHLKESFSLNIMTVSKIIVCYLMLITILQKFNKQLSGILFMIALIPVGWLIWEYLPGYLRMTILWDYRTLTRVLSIFLLLSLAEVFLVKILGRLYSEEEQI